MPPGARVTDVVQHGLGLLGMLAGALIGAAIIAGTCATGGLLGAALVAGSVAGGALAGGKIMNGLATIFNLPGIVTGTIAMLGSPNVKVNGLLAARAMLDSGACDGVMALYHFPLPAALIAQGSATVIINGQPAARAGDKLVCGGVIKMGSPTVIIGGPTATVLSIHDPEEILTTILTVVVIVSAIILTGGAVGALYAGTITAGMFFGGLALAGVFGAASWAAGKYLPPGWNQLTSGVIDLVGLATMAKLGEAIAEPIYPATGEVCTMAVDFVLPGALEVRFARYYASSLGQADWLGMNWTCTWGQRVVDTGTGVLLYFPGDGRRIVFEVSGDADQMGWQENLLAADVRLRRVEEGFEVRERSGRLLRFGFAMGVTWLVTSIEDQNANFLHFLYAEDGALRVVEHSGGYRLQVAGGPGRITTIDLEDGGQMHRLVGYSYDAAGCLSGVDNGSGQNLTYDYDAAGRMTRWQDRQETWTSYVYDAWGRCVESVGSNEMYQYRFVYDVDQRTTIATDPYGGTILVHYDSQNRVTAKYDQNGSLLQTEWDERGRRVRVIDGALREVAYTYDTQGNLASTTDAGGKMTAFEYDAAGQAVALVDAAGARWLRAYDERGNLIRAGLEGEALWHYVYDAHGNVVSTLDPAGETRSYRHNPAGLVIAATDCEGHTTRYERDAFGRITAQVDALGHTTRYGYNRQRKLDHAWLANGTELRWRWDAEGNLVERVGPDGGVYRYGYGAYDKLMSIQRPSGGSLRFEYDLEARLTGVHNEQGETWRYTYDAGGRLVGEEDFAGRVQAFRYDASGLLTERTNGLGETIAFERTKGGQVARKIAGGEETAFGYDANGMLAFARNAAIEVRFKRDAYGRVVEEAQGEHTVRSWFDGRGLRTRRRVDTREAAFRYDGNGRMLGLGLGAEESIELTRDALGQQTELRLARSVQTVMTSGGVTLRQAFDAMRNLTRQWTGAGSAVITERAWEYDVNGNPVATDESLWGASRFGYDGDGRLASVERTGGLSEGFRYNTAGEMTSSWAEKAGGFQTAARLRLRLVGRGGRLETVDETQFEYDADGRTVEKREGDRVWRYEWSAEAHLQSVVTPEGARWEYAYDAFGRRVRKSGPGGTTTYVWDGSVVAEEIREEPEKAARRSAWYFEPGTFRPLAKVEGGTAYACVLDQAGTPRELVTRTGKLAWSAQFTAFGEATAIREAGTNCPIRFQGQWFDEESGLHYNWSRYYDPETARYLSADPSGLQGGARAYGYVHNPLSWVDPLGLAGCNEGAGLDTEAGSRPEALNNAKAANDIPTSKQPDVTYKPGTPEGSEVGLDPARNGRMYEYTNSKNEKVWIREDYPAKYGAPDGAGDQGPHFNAGRAGLDPQGNQNLPQHHNWTPSGGDD